MNKVLAVGGIVIKELYRRKDFYVLFILTALITVLLGSVNLFRDEGVTRAIKEICLLLIWISTLTIAITTTARQIPLERESRTIFPLLAKPISRWQVLVGKFAGCWLAGGMALIVFYVFFAVISATREHTLPLSDYFQALWLHWQALGVVTALTMLGSVVLSQAANVTIMFVATVGILYVGQFLGKVASRMSEPSASILYGIYYAIPHLEFFDIRRLIIHSLPPVEWIYVGGATIYAWAYAALFLIAACLIFRRKALN